jgi:hypothetical protein
MIDSQRFLIIVIEAGSFIAAMAALVAGIIMAQVTKKFGTGILATGFKSISVGVFFIAVAILIDAAQSYVQLSNMLEIATVLTIIKEILFVIGTYIIVIGSKKTGDKLESLTK